MPHLPNREASRQSVWLPWVHRLASAWLRGEPIAVAPEEQPAIAAVAAALLREAAGRVRR
jgi:hypothetical protein